jgi:membrane protease YdiL (CAAX protease family)
VAGLVVLVKIHPEAVRMFQQALSGIPPHVTKQVTAAWTKDIATAPYLLLYAILGDGAMIAAALVLARTWLGAKLSSLGFTRFEGISHIVSGVAAGLALIIVSDIITAGQSKVFGSHPENVEEVLLTHHGLTSFFFDLLSVAVLAPVAEEVLFRGVIFTGLVQRMPLALAAGLSGLIFGIAHLDFWSILPLSVIGVGLALLYYRTGSLWPNIVAHATVNMIWLFVVYFYPQLAR